MINDMDGEKKRLLQFLCPTTEKLRILVIESCAYLPELRNMMPQAELSAVTADELAAEELKRRKLDVYFEIMDYREKVLPYEKENFDYIIAERCLEEGDNPQDMAAGIGQYIKQTGSLLTSFRNIRHWKVIKSLMTGHFYHFCRYLYAKPEMERLLIASYYKEAVFAPLYDNAPEGFADSLEAAGFENRRNELQVSEWLVKAARSTADIANLKSFFTPEIRRRLSRLMRRLEYGIAPRQNFSSLVELCHREQIFPAYLAAFSKEAIIHTGAFFMVLLQQAILPEQQDFCWKLMQEAQTIYTDEEVLAFFEAVMAKIKTGR